MKAKERKRVQNVLEKAPRTKKLERLREEFESKGFLSRKEVKILDLLVRIPDA